MTAAEKINFVNTNQSVEYFEKDVELYRRLFPDSRLNIELSRANQYNKLHLDGRMLLEILEVVCGETVLENRGIVSDGNDAGTFDVEKFKVLELDKTTYQERKALVKELGIPTDNQKNETLLAALVSRQAKLKGSAEAPVEDTDVNQAGAEEHPVEDTDVNQAGTEEQPEASSVNAGADADESNAEKKSGDQG